MPSPNVTHSNPSDASKPAASLDLNSTFQNLCLEGQSSAYARNAPSIVPFHSAGDAAREVVTAAARVMYSISARASSDCSLNVKPDALTAIRARITYDHSLDFKASGGEPQGRQIFFVLADPRDPSDLYLKNMDIDGAGRQSKVAILDLTLESLSEISKRSSGELRAVLFFFEEAPTLSEFAAMRRLEDSLKASGRDIMVRPAEIALSALRVPTVNIWQCNGGALTSWVTREEEVIASFKESLAVLIKGIGESPQIRRGSKQTPEDFLRQVLLLQETFALVFLDRVLLADNRTIEGAFDRSRSEADRHRSTKKWTTKLTELREAIEKKGEKPVQSLQEHAKDLARIFTAMIASEAYRGGLLCTTPLSIDPNHPGSRNDLKVRDKVKPVMLRKRTLSVEEVASIFCDEQRVTILSSNPDLVFVKPVRGTSRFQDFAFLLGRESGAVLLHLSAAQPPFVEYEGVAFVAERSEDLCRSALFQLELVRATVLHAAASIDVSWRGKFGDATIILADRMNEIVAAIDECELGIDSSAFSNEVAAFTQTALSQKKDLQSILPELRAVEVQALDALLLEHLNRVGITKPCFFELKDRRLKFLPAATGESLLEPLLIAVARQDGYESFQIKALVSWFAPHFSEVPELFRPAAQAIKGGLELDAVFSLASRTAIIKNSSPLISVAKSMGLRTLGERILSAKARRTFKTLEPFPSLNSRDDLEAVVAILTRMRECELAVEGHCKSVREDRLRSISLIPTLLKIIEQVTTFSSKRKDGGRPEEFDDAVMLVRPPLLKMRESESEFIAKIETILGYQQKRFIATFGRRGITREYLLSVRQEARLMLNEFNAAVDRIRELTIEEIVSLAKQAAMNEEDRKLNGEFEQDWSDFMEHDFHRFPEIGTQLTKDDFKQLYFRIKKSEASGFVGVSVERRTSDTSVISFDGVVVELNVDRVDEITPELLVQWMPPVDNI